MPIISPNATALKAYYRTLSELRGRYVTNEEGLRPAFQGLLTTIGRDRGWTLVPELRLPNGNKPDGTLVDGNTFYRGFWEAKDTRDKLEIEIKKKIDKGYPLTNIIFEDTEHAVLYQHGERILAGELNQPTWLADLLKQFFSFAEPEVLRFEQAVEEFQGRIPDLAQALLRRIRQEYVTNKAFQRAFEDFHLLCRQALNPQTSTVVVEEMLVQHLLTERLFRTIFDNPDFVRRNVIAAQIEQVIDALTSNSFSRNAFLGGLDRFYVAIEEGAKIKHDWSEKQAFLNVLYERFFQGFSVKQADVYGIVYTPQEVVDFMVGSVDEVLKQEFDKSLSSPGVRILDPCTGTGNFIVNILRRIAPSALKQKYEHDLFANEIMLLPYYIASLNIEHAYFEQSGHYLPFEGICFADTLDMVAEGHQASLFSEANTDRMERENNAEITVILGNPPYNVGQQNENDNNKNRAYDEVDKRIKDTYAKDSQATNRNKLLDAYVRFFRWATDRLGERDGVICMITNNSFVDQFAFDGMRKHLLKDFTHLYHLDLHGNVRKNPRLSGTTHNVFGIQVGVGITVAVRNSQNLKHSLSYYRVPEMWRSSEKLAFLTEKQSLAEIEWQELEPDEKGIWLTEGLHPEFADFLAMGSPEGKVVREVEGKSIEVQALFKYYSLGVVTNRDDWVYDFDRASLAQKVMRFVETYNTEVDRWKRAGEPTNIDSFVLYDDKLIKWSRDLKSDLKRRRYAFFEPKKIRRALYRPFTSKYYFFDPILSQDIFLQPKFFPAPTSSEAENSAIFLTGIAAEKPFMVLVGNTIADLHLVGAGAGTICFPYYTFDEDGSKRRENITDWALSQFQVQYGAGVSKRDIFHYIYALLHHPQYRERYAENLKRELPRIPLVPGNEAFETLVQIGAALANLHLCYEQAQEYPLRWVENPSIPFSWRVSKMRLTPDKTAVVVNDSLTLAGLPPECFNYRLGNRSALEWVIDQYQVSTDPRSGITTDPNNVDDPEYIVRLISRVVTVSTETVRLIEQIAQQVTLEEEADDLVKVDASGITR